jgi:hypothetical protein
MAKRRKRRIAQAINMVLLGHVTDKCRRAGADLICNPVCGFAKATLMKITHENGRPLFSRALRG